MENQDEYQVQIVLVKRLRSVGESRYRFEEVMRTDPVYTANLDESGHAEAVVMAIEKYGRTLFGKLTPELEKEIRGNLDACGPNPYPYVEVLLSEIDYLRAKR
jgi:hypothetical protein